MSARYVAPPELGFDLLTRVYKHLAPNGANT